MARCRQIRTAAGSFTMVALAVAVGARAQDTAAPAADEEKGAVLEEVIVTAEKREANLQTTAIAITALGADAMTRAGVSQAEDLNKLVPGVGIAQGGSSTQVYLRGVGNYGTNALADPAVAFNMDSVYIGRFSGISGNFYDLARVEVLKGPQGTLYGRNATGGAINIVTNKPTHEAHAGLSIGGGNYDLLKGDGFVNIPITETFAARLAAQFTNRDGYQTDGYDDDRSRSARLHLLWEPSDTMSLLLTGQYTHIGGNGPAQIPVTATGYVNQDNPWEGLSKTAPIALLGAVTPFVPNLSSQGLHRDDGELDVTVNSITAQFDAKLGPGTLTLLGNYMDTDNGTRSYGPGFLFQQDDTAEQNSLEVRYGGDTGRLRWVGGLYWYTEDQTSKFWVDQGFLFNQTGEDLAQLDDETKAVFGEVTFSVTDRLHLTGGLRYTDEEKTQNGQIFNRMGQAPGTSCPELGVGAPVFINTVAAAIPFAATNGDGTAYPFPYCRDTQTGTISFNDTSWKAGADFAIAQDSMVYLTVSRGFKAGGFFAAGDHAQVGNTFQPETLTAYALGSKNRFMNQRLQLNAEAFFWNYKDHQESYLAGLYPNTAAAVFGFVTQAADGEIYGLDLEFQALVTDNDVIGLKAQYLHAEYTDGVFVVARPNTAPPVTVCGFAQSATNPTRYTVDCTGQQMPRSPDVSFTADYYHTFLLGEAGTLVPGIRAQYSSSYWSAVDYNPLQRQESYTMWGADLTYTSASGKWSIAAYGDNLSNEDVFTNSFMYPATNVAMNSLRAPRTYGARFTMKF
jgi:iron complex outermembrane recepter protein